MRPAPHQWFNTAFSLYIPLTSQSFAFHPINAQWPVSQVLCTVCGRVKVSLTRHVQSYERFYRRLWNHVRGGWPQVWHCCSRLAVPVSYKKTPQEQLQVYVAMQLLRTFMHLPEFMIRQDALIRLLWSSNISRLVKEVGGRWHEEVLNLKMWYQT